MTTYFHIQPVLFPIDYLIYGYPNGTAESYDKRHNYNIIAGLALPEPRKGYIGPLLRRSGGHLDFYDLGGIGEAIRRELLPIDVVTAERNGHSKAYTVDDIIRRALLKQQRRA